MGTKPTSVSISGYNSAPPVDDGTISEANKVKWSGIKTKLSDPVKTAVESINTGIVNSIGTVIARSSNTQLGASNYDDCLVCTSTFSQTFAGASTLTAGWRCYIVNNGSGEITLTPNGSETINGASSVVLTPGAGGTVFCDGSNLFLLMSNNDTPGTVKAFAGATAPTGWLLCYGQAVSRTTYAVLFAIIGTVYGVGDNSTTFNLPDLRGRVIAGQDDMGGSSANRLTNQTGGLNGDTLGATGGAETHTLTTEQLAVHAHTITDPTHAHNLANASTTLTGELGSQVNVNSPGFANTLNFSTIAAASTGITGTNNAGSDSAHNNIQPTIILNYIIKA